MIWTILTGILCLVFGAIIGSNMGYDAALKNNFVGYYDVGGSEKVFFDPKAKREDIYEKEYLVLECVDLANPINAKEELTKKEN